MGVKRSVRRQLERRKELRLQESGPSDYKDKVIWEIEGRYGFYEDRSCLLYVWGKTRLKLSVSQPSGNVILTQYHSIMTL